MSTRTRVHEKVLRCPVCNDSVRSDRLPFHVTAVHPREQAAPRVRKALESAERSGRIHARRRPLAGGWWTRGRAIGVTIALAVVVLLVYAVLRAPPPAGLQNGKSAPDFSFTDAQGGSHVLSSYEGKPIVLWWIATWCTSCIQGTQIFAQQYYSQYHAVGVTLLEVESYNDLGQSGPGIGTFASQNGYTGQTGWVLGEGSSQGTSVYNPSSELDYYYVISSQRSIVTQGAGLPGSFGSALQAATGGS